MNDSQTAATIGTESAAVALRISKPAGRRSTDAREARRPSAPPSWKRALDVICICLALPVVVPVMACIAVAIRMLSPGPVFYKQVRVGHRRRLFLCWKFRTMKIGADDGSHQQHVGHCIWSNVRMVKMDRLGDPRLIPGGAILRAMGLDELPQLINVWRGEMSLVGPRPCTTYELEGYSPEQYARFETLPGLTGLWQVSGKNKTTFTEMIDLDIRYARTQSLRLDLAIMRRTLATVVEQVRDTWRGGPAPAQTSPSVASPPVDGMEAL